MSSEERSNMLKRIESLRALIHDIGEEVSFWVSEKEREEAIKELESDIKKIADNNQESFE